MGKPLTESVLRQLTSESLLTYLGHAETFEFAAYPGCSFALTGERVADLNYVVAGRRAGEGGHFADTCRTFISRDLPFLALVFPESGNAIEATANELGLVHVVDFPFMVRADAPIEPHGNDAVVVSRAVGSEAAEANIRVLSAAFAIPKDATRRVFPPALLDVPNVDVFLASIDREVVGTVTLIHQGDTTGVWSMAIDTVHQRAGIGRRLLSTAMADARSQRATRFFLGATPAGYPLYESLGFTTRTVARVWASGETHQA